MWRDRQMSVAAFLHALPSSNHDVNSRELLRTTFLYESQHPHV